MGLVKLAIRLPHLIVVLIAAIVIIGLVVLFRIPTDILPVFKTPAVQILTLYPGMPADIVERDITNRLERWTGQSNGIARQESRSLIGVSIVKDYFRPDIDPNTAMSQVTSYAISDLFYLPPGTLPPMIMPFDPTATIPLCLLSISSTAFDETKLYDIAYFDLRNLLQGIPGVIAPAVYGGKIRRILVYVDRDKLETRGLSPMDVVNAVQAHNVFIPTGNAKIGGYDYMINANAMVKNVEEINDFPVKIVDGAPVFVKDVARAEDSHQIQTNVVHIDGRRQVYIPIYRQPGASTVQVVEGVREALSGLLLKLPKGINLDIVMDQSTFVRKAIRSLEEEGVLGALLASLVILIFLLSLRYTSIVAMDLPVKIIAPFIVLYFTGNSLNAMTLGGIALAIGILIDHAVVVVENTARHLAMGKPRRQAAIEAAEEVSMPNLVSTLTLMIVFFPVIFLTGMGKFLFTPLAIAVVSAVGISYLISMTYIPLICAHFLPERKETSGLEVKGKRVRGEKCVRLRNFGKRLVRKFSYLYDVYLGILKWSLRHRAAVLGGIFGIFAASLSLYFFAIGTELLPVTDVGQFTMYLRAPSGTRLEKTEEIVTRVEEAIRKEIPASDLQMLITNLGVLYDWPAAYTPNAGPGDAFFEVQLSPDRKKTSMEYVELLRGILPPSFPGIDFSFNTGGLLSAALNFGLPSPINIQVEGAKMETAHDIAKKIQQLVQSVPGTADVRVQQNLDYPMIDIEIDRVKASYLGVAQKDVVTNVVAALNSSINFSPAFWLDHVTGNHYFVGAQYLEEDINSFDTLENIPITSTSQKKPVLLKNIAKFNRTTAPVEVNHVNIRRVFDVYANVSGRDVGSVARDIQKKLDALELPAGYSVHMRGEVSSMKESF
ncbi:MAG: efflux RND transporter permease subunit, partial [Candidatus Brocadiaceae bacterium]|nr:efflux RND transporter permease subunit [Candidatus Brocadiaceae bacterium]